MLSRFNKNLVPLNIIFLSLSACLLSACSMHSGIQELTSKFNPPGAGLPSPDDLHTHPALPSGKLPEAFFSKAGISLTPMENRYLDTNPRLVAYGVDTGDTVNFYKSNDCSGSIHATARPIGINKIASTISPTLSIGKHTFSAKIISATQQESQCIAIKGMHEIIKNTGIPVKILSTNEAFAALKDDGSVVAWGSSGYGGEFGDVRESLSKDVIDIFANGGTFLALKKDRSLISWGYTGSYGHTNNPGLTEGVASVHPLPSSGFYVKKLDGTGAIVSSYKLKPEDIQDLTSLEEVVGNSSNWAALNRDGSVVTWHLNPLTNPAPKAQLTSGVVKIYADSNNTSFAALKANGSVLTWGTKISTDPGLAGGVLEVHSNSDGFSALKDDGTVITWGFTVTNPTLLKDIVSIQKNSYSFAGLTTNNSVVTWGTSSGATNPAASVKTFISSGITKLVGMSSGYIAYKADGTFETWAGAVNGFSTQQKATFSSEVEHICTGAGRFIVIKTDGTAYEAISNSLNKIAENATHCLEKNSLAFIMNNQKIETILGSPANGSSPSEDIKKQFIEGVKTITTNSSAVAVITLDNKIVTWGSSRNGGQSISLAKELKDQVVAKVGNYLILTNSGKLLSWDAAYPTAPMQNITDFARYGVAGFAALSKDGFIHAWGSPTSGGSLANFAHLNYDIKSIHSTHEGFAAIRNDGSAFTWHIARQVGNLDEGITKIDKSFIYKGDTVYPLGSSLPMQSIPNVKKAIDDYSSPLVLKNDGTLIHWGYWSTSAGFLAVKDQLTDVRDILYSDYKYYALNNDGSVVSWDASSSATVAADIESIHQFINVPYGINRDGQKIWFGGPTKLTGYNAANFVDVEEVYYTSAMALAVKKDRTAFCIGGYSSRCTADIRSKLNNIKNVVVSSTSGPVFGILREDNSFVGISAKPQDVNYANSFPELASNGAIKELYGSGGAIAAILNDGSVTLIEGNQTSFDSVRAQLAAGVFRLESLGSPSGFVAFKADGSIVSWGSDEINMFGEFRP